MKVLEHHIPNTRAVKYFNLDLNILHGFNYLAVDCNGDLYSYVNSPDLGFCCWIFDNSGCEFIAKVDLEGLNWKDTLREV